MGSSEKKWAIVAASIASAAIIATIVFTLRKRKSGGVKNGNKSILLLGGLDNRAGDKSISEQVAMMRKEVGGDFNIDGFRYFDKEGVLAALKENPNQYVVLFSAGCRYALDVAKKINELGGDLKKMFILEPYAASESTAESVRAAVRIGVPPRNVFVGAYKAAGQGVVADATPTPNCSPSHWCSLSEVSKKIAAKA